MSRPRAPLPLRLEESVRASQKEVARRYQVIFDDDDSTEFLAEFGYARDDGLGQAEVAWLTLHGDRTETRMLAT